MAPAMEKDGGFPYLKKATLNWRDNIMC
jgi:hypothetical protein